MIISQVKEPCKPYNLLSLSVFSPFSLALSNTLQLSLSLCSFLYLNCVLMCFAWICYNILTSDGNPDRPWGTPYCRFPRWAQKDHHLKPWARKVNEVMPSYGIINYWQWCAVTTITARSVDLYLPIAVKYHSKDTHPPLTNIPNDNVVFYRKSRNSSRIARTANSRVVKAGGYSFQASLSHPKTWKAYEGSSIASSSSVSKPVQ